MDTPEKEVPAEVPYMEGYVKEDSETKEIDTFSDTAITELSNVAEHIEKWESALNKIIGFCIRRTYDGDWISHDKADTPLQDRTVNMTGAAADRIARDLGIQETKRTKPEKKFHDQEKKPGHYYYQCEGTYSFRGRTVQSIGVASTLKPFYSRKYGKDVAPSDIPEEYIMREAWRDCTKQAIKALFGLRKIPVMKLKELGFDVNKIKYVNFKDTSVPDTRTPQQQKAASTAVPNQVADVLFIAMETRKKKDNSDYQVVYTKKGQLSLFRPSDHEDAISIKAGIEAKVPVKVEISNKGPYFNIEKVIEILYGHDSNEQGDAQEGA